MYVREVSKIKSQTRTTLVFYDVTNIWKFIHLQLFLGETYSSDVEAIFCHISQI